MSSVSFREADGRSLTFGNATFDVVTADFTFSHVPGVERAIKEAFRVLQPEGSSQFSTATMPRQPSLSEIMIRYRSASTQWWPTP